MAKTDKKATKTAAAKTTPKALAAKGMPIDIGMSAQHREAIAKGLNGLLADTFTLYLTTHNFHWNVTGPMFNSLHTMFMDQYTELWNAVDPIAERIRALGTRPWARSPTTSRPRPWPMRPRSRPRPKR